MTVAYIYFPKEKKYDKIETGLLTNFDYQLYTSKDQEQRTSKIYKGKTAKGKKIKCQVLHVAGKTLLIYVFVCAVARTSVYVVNSMSCVKLFKYK